jgi:hypothetical protein
MTFQSKYRTCFMQGRLVTTYLMMWGGGILEPTEAVFTVAELRPRALPSSGSGQIIFGACTPNWGVLAWHDNGNKQHLRFSQQCSWRIQSSGYDIQTGVSVKTLYTVMPPYSRIIHFKTYHGYVKPRMIPNTTGLYNVIQYLCNVQYIHMVKFNW